MRFSKPQFILAVVAIVTVPTATYSAPPGIKNKPSVATKPGLNGVSAHPPATANLSLAGWNYALESDPLEKAWSWRTNLDASGPFETRVAFHYKSPQDYLVLRVKGDTTRAEVGFWRVTNGKAERLGEPVATLGAPHGQLTVQRSAWRVRALWNGKAVVTAFSDIGGERFGVATHGAAKLSDARMQPVEAPVFSDDFMRAQGPNAAEAPGDWHRVAGIWKTSGLIGPRADAALNPNPFVFRAEVPSGDGSAVATVGKWFWSDYTVTASVRPTLKDPAHSLVAGLAAYHQADGSSVVGLVDFRTGLAILRSGNRTLATGKPFRAAPDQWHRLFLEPGPGTVRLVVDGVERVRASTTASVNLAQGEATLTADLGGGNYADFDDVRVGPNDAISDDFRTAAVGRWDNVQGDWQTQPGQGQNAGRRVKVSAGTALTLTGNPEREEGLVEAAFSNLAPQTKGRGNSEPVGAVFAARDVNNYFVARKRSGAPLEIVEVANGAGKALATAQNDKGAIASISPLNSTITVEWREGVITAHLQNTTATATVAAVPEGRVGAWAGGAGKAVALTSFRALGAAPGWGEGALPERFQKDSLMQNWASNASAWQLGTDGVWWHTGDFFQDSELSLPVPALFTGAGATLLLAADPAHPSVGASLAIERDPNAFNLKLAEAGHDVKTFTLPEHEAKGQLRFVRRPVGNDRVLLRVALDGRTLLNETVASSISKDNAATATKTGVRLSKISKLDWEGIQAQTSHLLDYTFTSAPVDWESAAGRWEVSERWTCSPQWGFFMGLNAVDPTLWSRFAMKGDFTLEAYLATPMDQTRGERGPSDLNLTVDGDGRDLASGYSFVFAGNQHQANRVLRGDEVVVDKPLEIPPPKGSTHQDWFYVRLERRQTPQGLHFRYSVNGRVLADYTDANPLPSAAKGGHLAFWTYNGGLSIARVRLWHDGIESGSRGSASSNFLVAKAQNAPELKNALGQWGPRYEGVAAASARVQVTSAGGRRALQITNPQSGGDWTVFVTKQAFDAAQRPTLRFDYRVPSGVRVNLYAKVEGRWREIIFTGDAARSPVTNRLAGGLYRRRAFIAVPPVRVKTARAAILDADGTQAANTVDTSLTIGRMANVVRDDQWHTATFDLRAALQAANLGTKIEALAFAAPDRDYLRVGLGGNHAGATYWLSDFQAPESGKQTVAVRP